MSLRASARNHIFPTVSHRIAVKIRFDSRPRPAPGLAGIGHVGPPPHDPVLCHRQVSDLGIFMVVFIQVALRYPLEFVNVSPRVFTRGCRIGLGAHDA